jgi:hypothetical protein
LNEAAGAAAGYGRRPLADISTALFVLEQTASLAVLAVTVSRSSCSR